MSEHHGPDPGPDPAYSATHQMPSYAPSAHDTPSRNSGPEAYSRQPYQGHHYQSSSSSQPPPSQPATLPPLPLPSSYPHSRHHPHNRHHSAQPPIQSQAPSQSQPPLPHGQQHHIPPDQQESHHSHHSHHSQPAQSTQPVQGSYQTSNHARPEDVPSRSSPDVQKRLVPLSAIDDATGWRYSLDVVQQPQRARMCGFGDKDRRPITPPPCVRLIICDTITGKEFDYSNIDHTMFVLNVDLWDATANREVNLVRSSSSASNSSISSGSMYPYHAANGGDPSQAPYQQHTLNSNRDQTYNGNQTVGYGQEYHGQHGYNSSPSYPQNGSFGPPQQYFPQHQSYRSDVSSQHMGSQSSIMPYGRSTSGAPGQTGYGQDPNSLTRMAMISGPPQGMFTRNLIGSLAASAFRLGDTEDRTGIWFVLQDLSVRTEGLFRLKFSFVNVGPRGGAPRDDGSPPVNTGRAPILASCYSDIFQVFSAKKFPGVCESTPLSKAFATQGIKIPIRKDANMKSGDGEDDFGD